MSDSQKQATTGQPKSTADLLGITARPPVWKRPALWIGVAAVVAGVVGWQAWSQHQAEQAKPQYVTEELRKGNLTLTVSATGTLAPTRSVNVGSELSGTVRKVLVDVNDRIKQGQMLVELDTAKLQSQVLRSQASLASAQARLAQSQAGFRESQANLKRLEEVHRLSGGKVPSATELDAGRAAMERGAAEVSAAQASVKDAQAALASDQTNLSKAQIRSPIDGVVLTRSVDPGNAVAASLQAVTLFTVAEDLTQLKLEVNIDEADVSKVQEGQRATFTVSAYPSRQFPARVTRVSYGSTKTDNVITYTATLKVDNSDGSLRPGMTASATIVSMDRRDILLVPNAALRFSPISAEAAAAAQARPSSGGGIVGQLMPSRPRPSGGQRRPGGVGGDAGHANATRQLWVLEAGAPRQITVQTGISDGRHTEAHGDAIREGLEVITDQRTAGAKR